MTGVSLALPMTIRGNTRWRSAPPWAWIRLMQPEENLDLGHGLHMRVLVRDDAALLAEATSEEQDPAL
jgi:hypothetical protein